MGTIHQPTRQSTSPYNRTGITMQDQTDYIMHEKVIYGSCIATRLEVYANLLPMAGHKRSKFLAFEFLVRATDIEISALPPFQIAA